MSDPGRSEQGWTGPALSRAALDRAADRRKDADWLATAWSVAQVLVIDDERRVVVGDDGLVLVAAAELPSEPAERFFLGRDDAGTAYFSVVGELPKRLGARPTTLRDVGALLPARDAGLLVAAIGLANWHATHRRCPRCGAPTDVVEGGWVRRCREDGSDHFPRTDPAIIVLLHDGADRALLGRQRVWPPGRYSTLAGFVEPGESLEQAVAREVGEESGAVVDDIVYRGSQPWPFPASLMLGFEARVVGGDIRVADQELEDVRWFSREEIRAGQAGLPPPASIAHWLITGWLDRVAD